MAEDPRTFRTTSVRPGIRAAATVMAVASLSSALLGQTPDADAMIDSIRPLGQISASDQRRIGDWVQGAVDQLEKTPSAQRSAAAIKFRERFRQQIEHSGNAAAFKQEFPRQTASTAATILANPNVDPIVSRALGRVLLDLASPDAVPAALAGLKAKDAATRYFCTQVLVTQRQSVAGDKEALDRFVQAVRDAGLAETSPLVLSRLYRAISLAPNQVAAVFDAFLALFEKRLEIRRGPAVIADGAENDAYEFFRNAAVVNALSAPQKERLVQSLAVFLRLDAQRYATAGLKFEEIDVLERSLDAVEEILSVLIGDGKGGKIRDILANAGYDGRDKVAEQVALWIGDAETKQQGVLNAAPWNVSPGAP